MKTLILCIAFVLNLVTSEEVNAQHPVNNNLHFIIDGNNDYPLLIWKNKKETNTSYYIIEYSNDYVNYKIISTVKAVGHSNYPTNYSYRHVIDSNVVSNQVKYYRIVLVLMDGSRLYTDTKLCIPTDTSINQNVIANIVK